MLVAPHLDVTYATSSTFVVNSTGDLPDLNVNDGVCRTDANDCTLRAAIEQANALENLAQPDRIDFAIPGEGTKSIVPDSAGFGSLPQIQDPVVIDGTTQPGYAGVPLIFVDGTTASCGECGVDGLHVSADGSGSTIKGLTIGNFDGDGIELAGGDHGSVVESSSIGIGPNGSYAGNRNSGIRITDSSANRIGGTTPAQRVALGANGGASQAPQIAITGSLSTANVVEGSYIGLDADGTSTFDTKDGVLISHGAATNTIGGDTTQGQGNFIYGLYGRGVALEEAGPGNVVAGNTIGLDIEGSDGESPEFGIEVLDTAQTVIGSNVGPGGLFTPGLAEHGNVVSGGGTGVWIHGASSGTIVAGNAVGTDRAGTASAVGNGTGIQVDSSGSQIGPGNTVAYNRFDGVVVDTGTGNRIVANSIHDNGGEGIVLRNGGNNDIEAPDSRLGRPDPGRDCRPWHRHRAAERVVLRRVLRRPVTVANWPTPKAGRMRASRRSLRPRPALQL